MNLLNDSWIPVLREDGSSDTISPLDLLDDSKENPVVEIHTVRPDFDSAVLQFLIGLYQVLLSPEDEDDWRDLLDEPPTRSALSSKIELVLPAFSFDEGEFRFMQDASVKDTDTREIQKLLLDIGNTLFLKKGQIEHLCPRCVVMALLTLQLNATSGGSGHLTSLRGGGPVTKRDDGDLHLFAYRFGNAHKAVILGGVVREKKHVEPCFHCLFNEMMLAIGRDDRIRTAIARKSDCLFIETAAAEAGNALYGCVAVRNRAPRAEGAFRSFRKHIHRALFHVEYAAVSATFHRL